MCCVCARGQIPTTTPHNLADVEIVVYESWTAPIHRIVDIDGDNRTLTLSFPINSAWSGASGDRYYLQNMLELLDSPGEFYYDRVSGELWVYPTTGMPFPPPSGLIAPQVRVQGQYGVAGWRPARLCRTRRALLPFTVARPLL